MAPASNPQMTLYDGYFPMANDPDKHGEALDQQCGYLLAKPHNMKPALCHGLKAQRKLNGYALLTALIIPFGLFVLTFYVMSFELYYRYPGTAYAIVAAAFMLPLVIGALASQARRTEQRTGQRTWHLFIFVSGSMACFFGASLGGLNMSINARTYYDYISLGKVVGVDPGELLGQQLLDAGEIDFKAGTRLGRDMHSAWHKSHTYCVAPLVSADSTKLENYNFWAVGTNCCSPEKGDFSCGYVHTTWRSPAEAPQGPKGRRVLDPAAIQGYTLAVEQAVLRAYNIQNQTPIFLMMEKQPYSKIEACFENAKFWTIFVVIGYFFIQAALVLVFSQRYRIGWPSGYMDMDQRGSGHWNQMA